MNPSLVNHNPLFLNAGFQSFKLYRYWNEATKGLDFEGLMEDLGNAPEESVIVLHACAHNPTGVDPTREQWKRIADLMEVLSFKYLFSLFKNGTNMYFFFRSAACSHFLTQLTKDLPQET